MSDTLKPEKKKNNPAADKVDAILNRRDGTVVESGTQLVARQGKLEVTISNLGDRLGSAPLGGGVTAADFNYVTIQDDKTYMPVSESGYVSIISIDKSDKTPGKKTLDGNTIKAEGYDCAFSKKAIEAVKAAMINGKVDPQEARELGALLNNAPKPKETKEDCSKKITRT